MLMHSSSYLDVLTYKLPKKNRLLYFDVSTCKLLSNNYQKQSEALNTDNIINIHNIIISEEKYYQDSLAVILRENTTARDKTLHGAAFRGMTVQII